MAPRLAVPSRAAAAIESGAMRAAQGGNAALAVETGRREAHLPQ